VERGLARRDRRHEWADICDAACPHRCATAGLVVPAANAEAMSLHLAVIGAAHWVKPQLVAEVKFAEWTKDGLLRHPSFLGLREGKAASDVLHEIPE
jgi:ATP-dependent DNA ligase